MDTFDYCLRSSRVLHLLNQSMWVFLWRTTSIYHWSLTRTRIVLLVAIVSNDLGRYQSCCWSKNCAYFFLESCYKMHFASCALLSQVAKEKNKNPFLPCLALLCFVLLGMISIHPSISCHYVYILVCWWCRKDETSSSSSSCVFFLCLVFGSVIGIIL